MGALRMGAGFPDQSAARVQPPAQLFVQVWGAPALRRKARATLWGALASGLARALKVLVLGRASVGAPRPIASEPCDSRSALGNVAAS